MAHMHKKAYVWIIGLVIFGFILIKVNIPDILAIFSEIRIFYIVLALFLIVPLIAMKAYRWQYLLKMQDIDYSFRATFLMYLTGMYLGIITPGRVGEFVKGFYLKNDKKVSLGKAFSSVLVDRLFDLFMLIIMGCLGLLIFALPRQQSLGILAVVLVLISATGILLSKKLTRRVIQFVYKRITLRRYQKKMDESINDFYLGIKELKKTKLVIPLLITIFAYIIFYTQGYLIAKSLNIPISFFYLVFCLSLASLVALIPISIFGIGTRDVTLVVLFSAQGLTEEAAVSLSLALLFVFSVSVGGMGALAWLKRPVDLSI